MIYQEEELLGEQNNIITAKTNFNIYKSIVFDNLWGAMWDV